jgi:hypothetical protein
MYIEFEVIFDTMEVIGRHSCPVPGRLTYQIDSWSFYYEEHTCWVPTVDLSTLLIGTLEIEVNLDTNICVYVDGYHHYVTWQLSPLCGPERVPGILKVHTNEPLLCGHGYPIEDMVPDVRWFDPATGWCCVGNKERPTESQAVEFATGCVAVVKNRRLISLWLKPENWQEVANFVTKVFEKAKRRRWWQFWKW